MRRPLPPPPKTFPPVLPSVGIEARYRRRMIRMIEDMHASIMRWVVASYRANEPEMAQDRSPSAELRVIIRRLTMRWRRRFNMAAKDMAEYFAKAIKNRTDAEMRRILREGGFTVKLRHSAAVNDVLGATVNANVQLIRSIPEQYLGKVEGAVMRSVQQGRDLEALSKELRKSYGVTKKRAALIARDQNNKATAAINRARQIEIGVKEAIWVHSHAGKEPRPNHLDWGRKRKRYDVSKGMWDEVAKEWVFPGTLINCRCFSRSIIPGLQ